MSNPTTTAKAPDEEASSGLELFEYYKSPGAASLGEVEDPSLLKGAYDVAARAFLPETVSDMILHTERSGSSTSRLAEISDYFLHITSFAYYYRLAVTGLEGSTPNGFELAPLVCLAILKVSQAVRRRGERKEKIMLGRQWPTARDIKTFGEEEKEVAERTGYFESTAREAIIRRIKKDPEFLERLKAGVLQGANEEDQIIARRTNNLAESLLAMSNTKISGRMMPFDKAQSFFRNRTPGSKLYQRDRSSVLDKLADPTHIDSSVYPTIELWRKVYYRQIRRGLVDGNRDGLDGVRILDATASLAVLDDLTELDEEELQTRCLVRCLEIVSNDRSHYSEANINARNLIIAFVRDSKGNSNAEKIFNTITEAKGEELNLGARAYIKLIREQRQAKSEQHIV